MCGLDTIADGGDSEGGVAKRQFQDGSIGGNRGDYLSSPPYLEGIHGLWVPSKDEGDEEFLDHNLTS